MVTYPGSTSAGNTHHFTPANLDAKDEVKKCEGWMDWDGWGFQKYKDSYPNNQYAESEPNVSSIVQSVW